MEVFDAAELWSRDQIEHTQLTRLKATVAHVCKSEFYRRRLDEAGVTPESITSLDDIRRIPFTTKQDLRDQYPTGLLCVPRSEIVRMHCSSGTTGSPVAICHTQNDINCWADLMARFRRHLDQRPEEFSRLVRRFDRQEVFSLTGPEYVRSKGQTTELLRPWYQKKSLSLQFEAPLDERIFSPALAEEIVEQMKQLVPFYRYFAALCASDGNPNREALDG